MKYFLLILFALPAAAQQGMPVTGQNKSYPLYTQIDSNRITQIRNSKANDIAKEQLMREYLKPLCDKNDALSCYLLAVTHDKFSYGRGNPEDAKIALALYKKAADGKLAAACMFLYHLYRYNFMNTPMDAKQSLHYLHEGITYGDDHTRAKGYRELAGIFYQRTGEDFKEEFKGMKADRDSVKYYLQRSLDLEPKDTWTLDFMGSLYEDEKDYKTASNFYIQSTNENSTLKVANWLARGKKLPKDTETAMAIVWEVMAEYQKQYGNDKEKILQNMGTYNPLIMLNIFYKCYSIIPKPHIGAWEMSSLSCDDYNYITQD